MIYLETKKIIKNYGDVVFFEDNMHLEDCSSGSNDKALAVKVDISSKLDLDESQTNSNNFLEADKANISSTKSTCVEEASEFDYSKKPATKTPPPPQYSNETMGNSKYLDRTRKPVREWWQNHILLIQDKEHANMATTKEPRYVIESIALSDAIEWELAMLEEYKSFIANGSHEVQMGVSYEKKCKTRGGLFQSKVW